MEYDVLIVGAATSGAFLAKRLAKKGYKVLVLEKDKADTVGSKMDIFHVAAQEFERFGLTRVRKGDAEWAFEFTENYVASPTGKYPKASFLPMVGLHMHPYVSLMNQEAIEAGAEITYQTKFVDFLWENDEIIGVVCDKNGESVSYRSKVVVDCSGIGASCRMKCPKEWDMDYTITENDLFYVILRYVTFADKKHTNVGYPSHKAWIAPCADEDGGIIGIGACHSYAYAEEMYKKFCDSIALPQHTVVSTERGVTPYTRPPYSFVHNRFIACGDAACLTKPNNGEGVTSSMVQLEIVEKVLDKAFRTQDFSRENLWEINTEYNKVQGADFSMLRAVLTKAIGAKDEEFEYFFQKEIIFKESLLKGVNEGAVKITFGEIRHILFGILGGMLCGKIHNKTIRETLKGLLLGLRLQKLYKNFPPATEGFSDWCKKAEKLWNKVGKMQ